MTPQARKDLLLQWKGLPYHSAMKRVAKEPDLMRLMDDLVQAGWVGMCRVVDGYDESRGIPFGCYAWPAIRDAISKEIRSEANASFNGNSKATFAPRVPLPVAYDAEANDPSPFDQVADAEAWAKAVKVVAKHKPKQRRLTKRNRDVFWDWFHGGSYSATGRKFDLCRENVSQIVEGFTNAIRENLTMEAA